MLKLFVFLLFAIPPSSLGQKTWCGKNYRAGEPVEPPSGHYPTPAQSSPVDPLVRFNCNPAVQPYVEGEDSMGSVLVDLEFTHTKTDDANPIFPRNPRTSLKSFLVSVSTEGIPLLTGRILQPGRAQKLSFPLFALKSKKEPYVITCRAVPMWEVGGAIEERAALKQAFIWQPTMRYLPPNPLGPEATVKIDSKTQALLVYHPDGHAEGGGSWKPFIPYGFYTSFDGYLSGNLSALDEAVARGHNLVHPVPTFGNLSALEEVLDRMEERGLWLMYDTRWSYKNTTELAKEVDRIKKRKNLLLWYTADEPDGWGDPFLQPRQAYQLIHDLDGYRPVSLVLNCQDYHFRSYTFDSADILLQDTYPIGINATYSTVYDTPCTLDFGDCGCDNCAKAGIQEVAKRLDGIHQMLDWDSKAATPVWSVVQAFGNESFWTRAPTGKEYVSQVLVGLIHGSKGFVPWLEPTTHEIASVSLSVGKFLEAATPYVIGDGSSFSMPIVDFIPSDHPIPAEVAAVSPHNDPQEVLVGGVGPAKEWKDLQIGLWTRQGETLLVASHLGTEEIAFRVTLDKTEPMILLNLGAKFQISDKWATIWLESGGSIAFVG